MTANEACCVCGGGQYVTPAPTPKGSAPTSGSPAKATPSPSQAPTPKASAPPTGSPTESQTSSPSETASLSPSARPTSSSAPTAKQSNEPSSAETSPPTASALGCVDSPKGWYDSDGARYDCEWYKNGKSPSPCFHKNLEIAFPQN